MKHKTPLAIATILLFIMSGCGPKSASSSVSPIVATPPAPSSIPTSTASTADNGYSNDLYGNAYGNDAASTPAQVQTAAGPATLTVSQKEGIGSYLVDANGMTVYLTTYDTGNTSTCSGYCADNWPALTATDQPVAGDGVDASLLGTMQRDDGTTQVTYNGHPLYTFNQDKAPGDTNGQGTNGTWYVISPTGTPVK